VTAASFPKSRLENFLIVGSTRSGARQRKYGDHRRRYRDGLAAASPGVRSVTTRLTA
jgi:hypothetical protein